MKVLKFSQNWNNKLFCESFSTVRDKSYDLGEIVEVSLFDKTIGAAEVVNVHIIESNDFSKRPQFYAAIAWQDAGMPLLEFKKLLNSFYPDYERLALISLRWREVRFAFPDSKFIFEEET